jgi:hypothetical protein
MANALERATARASAPAPKPDEPMSPTDVARLLEGVDQDKANAMVSAFEAVAQQEQAKNPEAMWAVAILQARVLAAAEMGNEQVWVAARFQEMVALALPAMILATEKGRRAAMGEPKHDA